MNKVTDVITFGGGCFWCTEAAFSRIRGVVSVVPGYAGGDTPDPTYEQVCAGTTGHAEVVRVEYDPNQISLSALLDVFFTVHDPTTLDRQGNDVGPQYRSIILYSSEDQRQTIEQYIKNLTKEQVFPHPIVTVVKPLQVFYLAESEHVRYFERNPEKLYCQLVIYPKLLKLKERYKQLLQE